MGTNGHFSAEVLMHQIPEARQLCPGCRYSNGCETRSLKQGTVFTGAKDQQKLLFLGQMGQIFNNTLFCGVQQRWEVLLRWKGAGKVGEWGRQREMHPNTGCWACHPQNWVEIVLRSDIGSNPGHELRSRRGTKASWQSRAADKALS